MERVHCLSFETSPPPICRNTTTGKSLQMKTAKRRKPLPLKGPPLKNLKNKLFLQLLYRCGAKAQKWFVIVWLFLQQQEATQFIRTFRLKFKNILRTWLAWELIDRIDWLIDEISLNLLNSIGVIWWNFCNYFSSRLKITVNLLGFTWSQFW